MGTSPRDDQVQLPNGNPIITHKYTSDPTAIVHDGVVYLYTGHDEAPAGGHDYVMNEWLCFSSRDLATWTEQPVPLRAADFAWSSGRAYASWMLPHRGAFYWFVSVADENGDSAIGVAVSSSPSGPFEDHLGRPLVRKADLPPTDNPRANLDPSVIVVDDVPHLVWGNRTCYATTLTPDLRGLAGPITTIDLPEFEEGAHLHHRDGWYYLSYGYGMPERVAYATSRSPAGPWTFAGLLNEVPGNCATNRPCILQLEGDWYFLYHNGVLPGGDSHHRSVCLDRLDYDPDGTMRRVVMTSEGVTAR
ncbi:family 43 glycosylhydrolase [Georgenia alba]|uniref:Family 43 glycosylhydrolase n=1 Tax=Georgenia alba TaxID=2233858 RepID=A0ABW2QAH5_9MICO